MTTVLASQVLGRRVGGDASAEWLKGSRGTERSLASSCTGQETRDETWSLRKGFTLGGHKRHCLLQQVELVTSGRKHGSRHEGYALSSSVVFMGAQQNCGSTLGRATLRDMIYRMMRGNGTIPGRILV